MNFLYEQLFITRKFTIICQKDYSSGYINTNRPHLRPINRISLKLILRYGFPTVCIRFF